MNSRASSRGQIDLYGPLAEWHNVRGCNPRYPGSIPGRASNFMVAVVKWEHDGL